MPIFKRIIITITLLAFGFLLSDSVLAVNDTMPSLQVNIPGVTFTDKVLVGDKYQVPWISQYIQGIFKYAIGIIGVLSSVVLMWGGVIWLTAGGNASRIGEAKAWIGGALTGLVLALCSVLLLNTINPELTKTKNISISRIENIPSSSEGPGCCIKDNVGIPKTTKEECLAISKSSNTPGTWGGEGSTLTFTADAIPKPFCEGGVTGACSKKTTGETGCFMSVKKQNCASGFFHGDDNTCGIAKPADSIKICCLGTKIVEEGPAYEKINEMCRYIPTTDCEKLIYNESIQASNERWTIEIGQGCVVDETEKNYTKMKCAQ